MFGENRLGFFFSVAVGVLIFVMLYIWQSIEVRRIKVDCIALVKKQEKLVRESDSYIYAIERLRRMDIVEANAEELGMRPVTGSDLVPIEVDSK